MPLPLKGIVLPVALAVVLSSLSRDQLFADDYADGVAAFDKGDFAIAVDLFTKVITWTAPLCLILALLSCFAGGL